jgi:hypothetical protein
MGGSTANQVRRSGGVDPFHFDDGGDHQETDHESSSMRARAQAWWDEHPRLLVATVVTIAAWLIAFAIWRATWNVAGSEPAHWLELLTAEMFTLGTLVLFAVLAFPRPIRQPVEGRKHGR